MAHHRLNPHVTTTRRRTGYFASTLVVILVIPRLGSAQTSDTMPPSLVSLDFNPKAVDVTMSAQAVTVTAHVTDDLSGTSEVAVEFVSPSFAQSTPFAFLNRTSGTSLDGVYQGSVQIPMFSESGVWSLDVFLFDNAGNSLSLQKANLQAAGFPTDLTVTSNPDTTPPQVRNIAFSASSIDVSAGAQTLTVTLDLTDAPAGVTFNSQFVGFPITFQSPSGRQHQYLAQGDFTLISGTAQAGTWQATHSFPQFSEAGTWSIASLDLTDAASNRLALSTAQLTALGLTTAFTIVSLRSDTTAPTVTGLDFSPKLIDTSLGSQNITVTMNIVDDLSGVDFSPDTPTATFIHGIEFISPSHGQERFSFSFPSPFQLTAGSRLDGTWQGSVSFPQFSEEGTWEASLLSIKDAVQNVTNLSTAQLAAMGFPSNLIVVKPSLVVDGTTGPGGGIVMDQVFGARAEITFPPGVIGATTQVAIDVFQSPLQVPIPSGFSGPGTFFVNVELSPTPNFPLPAPGVTVVLPLPEAMIPGAEVDLFRVDPTSGMLVPALDTSGVPVVGTVDPGGLSATFIGVSHLSVLVGLIPAPISTTTTTSTTSTTRPPTTTTSTSTTTTTTVPATAQCPQGMGFWKTHPGQWPVSTLMLGSRTYTQTELLALLTTPVVGDASLILTRQLIAAKLNIANGSDPTPIASTITDADSLLSGFAGKLPYKVGPSSVTGHAMTHDAGALADYNAGALTPTCSR